MTSEPHSPGAPGAPPIRRKALLAVLLMPLFMALIAVSVINVALPAIRESLGADSESLQWVLSGYALSFGLLLVPAGRLGDATGRRRILLVGIILFTAGSLLAGLAPDVLTLNLARLLQGVGSGLLNPQTIGLIQQHFRGQDRARAFAALGTTVAVATAVGPVIGGLLIQMLGPGPGWRWMFLVNVPIGILAVIGALRFVPDDRVRRAGRADLDPAGTILLAIAILLIMLPFLERGGGALLWMTVPAGLLVLGGWWAWEARYKRLHRAPMVDPAIFANRAFRNGMAIVAIYFLGATSIWIVVPLYLQVHLGHSAFQASIIGLPSSICAAIASQMAGRYVLRFGRRLVIAGFIVAITGLIGTALLSLPVESGVVSFWLLALPLSLIGVSQGMTISPNQTLTLNSVDPRYGGVAGGILQLGQRMGAAVGTAMIPGILFGLTESGTSWSEAFIVAMTMIVVLAVAALGLSVIDRQREKALVRGD